MKENVQFSGIEALKKGADFFHPGLSVDCVVLGFHKGMLKILLTKYKGFNEWMLPGSFILKNENIDDAAYRILKDRTGLDKVYLNQFYLFGNLNRNRIFKESSRETFKILYGTDVPEDHWYLQRIMTVGYYALVEFSKVKLRETGYEGEEIRWFDLHEEISFHADHKQIIEKALETIRLNLGTIPVGRELLSEKFTMTELRVLYESLLGHNLDRRNFQRKILSLDFINNLNEQRRGGAHKSPFLYSFDAEKYELALRKGFISTNWEVF